MSKVTVPEIAKRLKVHEQTATMTLKTGIVEGECMENGWECVEEAFAAYLQERGPVSTEDIYEVTQRFITSSETTRAALYDLDLLIAERDIPPERVEAADYFRDKVHELIDDMTNVIDLGNEAIQEAQKRMPQ